MKKSCKTKKVKLKPPSKNKELEAKLKASIKKIDKDEKVRFMKRLHQGKSKSLLAGSEYLDEIFAMHRKGKSSVDIAKFLLEKDSYIKDLYAKTPTSKRIVNLSVVIRKFLQKAIGSFDDLPNYHVEAYMHRQGNKINEIQMMEAMISYMLERVDRWIKFERNSPVPMKDARMETQLAFESLERLAMLKSTLGIDLKTSEPTVNDMRQSELYMDVKKKLAEITNETQRKEVIEKLHGVPNLKRDVA